MTGDSTFGRIAYKPRLDNARVNRDAATRTGVGLVESDIMGGTTIRRLIGHKDFTASVQRFVIQQHFLIASHSKMCQCIGDYPVSDLRRCLAVYGDGLARF